MSASSGPSSSPAGPSTSQRPAAKQRDPRETARLVVAIVVGGLLAAFALLNLDRVKVNWIFGTWSTPLIVVILVSFGVGALTGGFLVHRRGGRARRRKPAPPAA